MADSSKMVRARAGGEPEPPRFEGGGLRIGSRTVPLYSGAMHYWRLAPAAWRPGLQSLKQMGLQIVETYVPWAVHETEPGKFDFGSEDPRKDLGRFLREAAEEGLWVFLRPGPHINAEMTLFGIPEWIIYDKDCQARSPRSGAVILPFPPKMFPVPSYASRKFLGLTKAWFAAVGDVVREHMYPHGRVILTQVDNEAAYYFRNATYDQDYHEDAAALWQRWLSERYEDVGLLATAHRQAYERWADAAPPSRFDARSPAELVRHLDWAEFREELIARSLENMQESLGAAGMGTVPAVHNIPLGDGGVPLSVARIEESLEVVGFDYYHAARDHHTIKRRTLYLAGTSRLPYAPEMGVGTPPWFTPLHHSDSLYCAMAALAFGLRGFNLYMAVDRDRWCGAPIDSLGRSRKDSAVWTQLIQALQRVDFHRLSRRAPVALVFPRDYARLSRVTNLFGVQSPANLEAVGATPVSGCREDTAGLSSAVQVDWWRVLAGVAAELSKANVPYVYVDSEADAERFEGFAAVVCPSFDFTSDRYWQRIESVAEGGTRVILGPQIPTLSGLMEPDIRRLPEGAVVHNLLDTKVREELVRGLADELSLRSGFTTDAPGVEVTVHEGSIGPTVLFVLNPSRTGVRATLRMPKPSALVDALSGERLESCAEPVVALEPQSVRMLILENQSSESAHEDRPSRPSARRGETT